MSDQRVEFSAATRRLALARCAGRCERCGKAGRLELHHRLYRSRGGLGGPENAAALCGFGNAGGCHGFAHSGAGEDEGWSVASGVDPASVPVVLQRFGFVLLAAGGALLRAVSVPCWPHSAAGAVPSCSWCRCRGELIWEVSEEKGWAL